MHLFEFGPTYPDNLLGRLRRLGSPLAREDRLVDRLVSPIRRPVDRAYYRHSAKLRELGDLGESAERVQPAATRKRVLVLSLRMWADHTAYESVIAHALRLRGADVTILTCGGGQPICEVGWGRRIAPRPCDRCAYLTDRVAHAARLPQRRLADEFEWGSRSDRAPRRSAPSSSVDPAGLATASVAWFTKSSDPRQTPDGAAVEADFDVSVAAVAEAFARILERLDPDVVFALNGLFAAERAIRNVATERGVRVVTYEMAPRKDALVFGQASPAPEMVTDGLAEDQARRVLSEAENEALDALLLARRTGAGAHEQYFDRPLEHDREAVRQALGLGHATRVVSAFTNLAWDTALLGKDIAYDSQFDWLARASEIVAGQEDSVLVVRVHPAESRWGTAQPVEAELRKRLGKLPRSVVLIRPEDPVSSYGLLEGSDLVLCYTTTVGLEAAVRGLPVAVAAQTHYRGRGFTTDIESHEDMENVIARPPAMSSEQVELARRYAFAFFFRLMIPFTHVRGEGGRLVRVPPSADELVPGRDPYLDFVCERILDGGEFYLPSTLALPRVA
jgi:Capsule polysaccharide biosynthesis protein